MLMEASISIDVWCSTGMKHIITKIQPRRSTQHLLTFIVLSDLAGLAVPLAYWPGAVPHAQYFREKNIVGHCKPHMLPPNLWDILADAHAMHVCMLCTCTLSVVVPSTALQMVHKRRKDKRRLPQHYFHWQNSFGKRLLKFFASHDS